MNIALNKIISLVGDGELVETKSGKNAKKKIVNLGLSKFIVMAFMIIFIALVSVLFLLISRFPASRHIFHARYSKYAAPTNLIVEKTWALIFTMADNPKIHAKICGTIPSVHPKAAIILARHLRVSPVVIVYTAPVPGISTTTREVRRNSGLIIVCTLGKNVHLSNNFIQEILMY